MIINMEMKRLFKLLDEADVPYEICYVLDTKQMCYPDKAHRICDAVCHQYSYGGEMGLLEIMGLVSDDACDDVEGWLTAEEVANRIIEHFNKNKGSVLSMLL